MPFIPLEDNFADVVAKAQRGLHITDEELLTRADLPAEELAAIRAGQPRVAALRRIARHLRLSPDALEALATQAAYPRVPVFPRGFAFFNSPFGDMTVNNYLVWDAKTREAAVVDTGAEIDSLLGLVAAERLRVTCILLTHAHRDHVACLDQLRTATGAEAWINEREVMDHSGVRRFSDQAYFHLGVIAIKCLPTGGHSPGQTTFYVQGLARPLALCGDALFSSSIGGSDTHFEEQVKSTRARIFSLPRQTVIGPGHGPLTTLAHEREHNPFFAPDRVARPVAASAPSV